MLQKILNIFKNTLFRVDQRVLALFRISFGTVMFLDILRRIPYVELFYSDRGVLPISYLLSTPYKSMSFSLLPAFGSPREATLFFIAGLIFSLFFIVGYRTKLFQILTTIILLSIHNKVTLIENAGDTVMNNFMIITLFMPLGRAWSLDALRKKLKQKRENSPSQLNDYVQKPIPTVYSLTFFFCLIQLAMIYFFNYTNKSGGTWSEGTSLHYFFHLDTFLTPIGYWAKYNLSADFKAFLTHTTIFLESTGPFMIFFPFFTRWVRGIYFLLFVGFHLCIGLFMQIGMFSWVMIVADLLLISGAEINFLSNRLKQICGKPITVVYDSTCGFCHQVARIFTRLDVYNKITWQGSDWENHSDQSIIDQKQNTILAFFNDNPENVKMKSHAFYHILNKIPFFWIFSWLLILPGLKQIANGGYFLIAKYRTRISSMLGMAACGLPLNNQDNIQIKESSPFALFCMKTGKIFAALILCTLMYANIYRAFVMNEPYKSEWSLREKAYFRRTIKYLRMNQKWNMFSPNVKKSDCIIIIDGVTDNGTHLDPLTGEKPLDKDNIDFEKMDLNYGQFLRKYSVRISKRNDSPALEPLTDWLLRGSYGTVGTKRPRLESFKIWKVTQSSPAPGAEQRKYYARILHKYPDENNENNIKGLKRKPEPSKIGYPAKTPTKLKKQRPPKRRR